VLGDVVLAYETIAAEAADQGKTFEHHLAHLLVHGTLHLCRYDHDKPADAEKMENLERKILKELNIKDPYAELPAKQDAPPAPETPAEPVPAAEHPAARRAPVVKPAAKKTARKKPAKHAAAKPVRKPAAVRKLTKARPAKARPKAKAKPKAKVIAKVKAKAKPKASARRSKSRR